MQKLSTGKFSWRSLKGMQPDDGNGAIAGKQFQTSILNPARGGRAAVRGKPDVA